MWFRPGSICFKVSYAQRWTRLFGPCSKANGARSSPDRRPRTKAARRQRAGWPWNFWGLSPAHSWIKPGERTRAWGEESDVRSCRVCAGMGSPSETPHTKRVSDVLQAGARKIGRCLDLKYLLQAVDDPSCSSPQEGMGGSRGRPAVLGRRFENPRKGSSPIWRVWPHSSHR